MITKENILLWLKKLPVKADNYYCGYLDNKKEKSFGIYDLKNRFKKAVGGKETTLTHKKGVSILIHWTQSTRETENKAVELYKAIQQASHDINNLPVSYIEMAQNAPVDVGADENGIMEQVIEFNIYYTEKEI